MAVWGGMDKLITYRFRNSFREEGTLEVCLGREAEIGQVEKRGGGQSLKGGRRLGKSWHFQG